MGLIPDFVLDYISVNTFWTILLIVHGLLAVALLGALSHQAMSVLMPVRQVRGLGGFVTRFRAVQGAGYATAVCVLWIVTFIFGAWIYTKYRMYVRIPIEQAGLLEDAGRVRAEGAPCHHRARAAADLLVLLEERAQSANTTARANGSPSTLAAMGWFMFLVGHIVNNVRGFGS